LGRANLSTRSLICAAPSCSGGSGERVVLSEARDANALGRRQGASHRLRCVGSLAWRESVRLAQQARDGAGVRGVQRGEVDCATWQAELACTEQVDSRLSDEHGLVESTAEGEEGGVGFLGERMEGVDVGLQLGRDQPLELVGDVL
jgi:hypothetical protein